MALLGGKSTPREDLCMDCGYYNNNCICHTLCPHKTPWEECDECNDVSAELIAEAIRFDQMAELDAIEYSMGIEPSGWQDSHWPNEY